MHVHENTLFDLDIRVRVTQNVAQNPLHHVTYSDTKFENAMSNGLGGDNLQENTLFDTVVTKCCSVPSTSCDLFRYKV